MHSYKPVDLSKITTTSLHDRPNKVNIRDHFSRLLRPGLSFTEFLDSMPRLLGAESLRKVVEAVITARRKGRPVVAALGGHVIKCGLQPVLKSLIEADAVTAVVMNGAAAIHDFEISLSGATSEDVGPRLSTGEFGFAEETGAGINRALKEGRSRGFGFGEAIGRCIIEQEHPFREYSLLALCAEKGLPATVHVVLGADIVHQHPTADGGVTGEMSFRDFRLVASVIGDLGDGGVWLNLGSAVVLPEVFLKGLSVARNLGNHVERFTTANFDMIQHYRPLENVVRRPVAEGGTGLALTGHHEILLPLFAQAVLEGLSSRGMENNDTHRN